MNNAMQLQTTAKQRMTENATAKPQQIQRNRQMSTLLL